MARDRFIWFEPGKVPSPNDLDFATRDFLDALVFSGSWNPDAKRHYFILMGEPSHFARRLPYLPQKSGDYFAEVRGFEVYISDDSVDVITRMADDATNALADELARIIARTWNGRLEMG